MRGGRLCGHDQRAAARRQDGRFAPRSQVLDLVAAATGDLFQGKNVVEIERMFDKARGITGRSHHYFNEIVVFSTNLMAVWALEHGHSADPIKDAC